MIKIEEVGAGAGVAASRNGVYECCLVPQCLWAKVRRFSAQRIQNTHEMLLPSNTPQLKQNASRCHHRVSRKRANFKSSKFRDKGITDIFTGPKFSKMVFRIKRQNKNFLPSGKFVLNLQHSTFG